MLRDVANELAVKVKVAETKIFPIADQQQRLIVALVHGQSVTAIAFPVLGALPREAGLVVSVFIEPEDAGITVAVRDIDRTVRSGHNGCHSPLIWLFESRFAERGDFLH